MDALFQGHRCLASSFSCASTPLCGEHACGTTVMVHLHVVIILSVAVSHGLEMVVDDFETH